jgi:hypothetical protein
MEALVAAWRLYEQAKRAEPYVPDTVQAYGLAFAVLWRENAPTLRSLAEEMGIEEFDYSTHHQIMPRLADG